MIKVFLIIRSSSKRWKKRDMMLLKSKEKDKQEWKFNDSKDLFVKSWILSEYHSEHIAVFFMGFWNQQCPVTLPYFSNWSIQERTSNIDWNLFLRKLGSLSFSRNAFLVVSKEIWGEVIEVISLSKTDIASNNGRKIIDLSDNLERLTFINVLHNDYKINMLKIYQK